MVHITCYNFRFSYTFILEQGNLINSVLIIIKKGGCQNLFCLTLLALNRIDRLVAFAFIPISHFILPILVRRYWLGCGWHVNTC